MEALTEQRAAELQAIIIVEHDDGRLYPIVHSEHLPKCLLRVANRELLAYQLDLLAKSGVLECYIVAEPIYQPALASLVSHYTHGEKYASRTSPASGGQGTGTSAGGSHKSSNSRSAGSSEGPESGLLVEVSMSISIVVTEGLANGGSVDGLRAVADRIRGDFIVIHSDVFCKAPLGPLAQRHRMKSADVTMLLSRAPTEESSHSDKKTSSGGGAIPVGGKRRLRMDEEDQEWIGFNDDERVLIKTPHADLDASLTISKALLHHSGPMSIRGDLMDLGIYIFSKWVLELVCNYTGLAPVNAASGNTGLVAPSSSTAGVSNIVTKLHGLTVDTSEGIKNDIDSSAITPQASAKFVSIRADLLPFLINRQYQPVETLMNTMPMLRHRRRELDVLEPWLHATYSNNINPNMQYDLLDSLAATLSSKGTLGGKGIQPVRSQGAGSRKTLNSNDSYVPDWSGSADDLTNLGKPSASAMSSSASNQQRRPSALLMAGSASNLSAEGTISNEAIPNTVCTANKHIENIKTGMDLVRCYAWVYDDFNCPATSTINSDQSTGSGTLWEPINFDTSHSISSHGHGPEQLLPSFVPSSLNMNPPFAIAPGEAGNSNTLAAAAAMEPCLMLRVTSLTTYLCLNKDLPIANWNKMHTPYPRPQGYHKKEQSTIGQQCKIADKVTLKSCTLGDKVVINTKSKLNYCLLFDQVVIGENSVIQNSIIGAGAVVEAGCNLNECYIGAGVKISSGSKMKGESIAADTAH